MKFYENTSRIGLESYLLGYRSDLLTHAALNFLLSLQERFGPAIKNIRQQEQLEQQAIDRDIDQAYGYLSSEKAAAIRTGDWQIGPNAVSDFMKKRGIILVTPAAPEMIIKAMTTEKKYGSRPVANMIDFEDAFHLDIQKVLDGQRALMQLKKGKMQSGSYIYDQTTDGRNVTRIRINGFNTPPISEIRVDQEPIERCLFDFGLHFFHIANKDLHNDPFVGPYYVLPKIDYRKALIWIEIFKFSEQYFNLAPKTIKCSGIIETLKGDFEIQEMIFTLAGGTDKEVAALQNGEKIVFESSYIEALCSGRHDRVFDSIRTYHRYDHKMYPESRFTGMQDTGAQQSWAQLAEIATLRGLTAVGGMVVALTTDANTREKALKITEDSLRHEHQRGSHQAWQAMPDTTALANDILTRPMTQDNRSTQIREAFLLPLNKRTESMADIEKTIATRLQTTPVGTVSYQAIYHNINQAIEYIEAWLRGHGVIPYRQRLAPDQPIIMQNMATTERARSELWTWQHHQVELSDRPGVRFDKNLFLNVVNKVLNDIKISKENGFIPKGKMSAASYAEGYYAEAAEILTKLVLDDTFVDNIKFILLDYYQELQKPFILEEKQDDFRGMSLA